MCETQMGAPARAGLSPAVLAKAKQRSAQYQHTGQQARQLPAMASEARGGCPTRRIPTDTRPTYQGGGRYGTARVWRDGTREGMLEPTVADLSQNGLSQHGYGSRKASINMPPVPRPVAERQATVDTHPVWSFGGHWGGVPVVRGVPSISRPSAGTAPLPKTCFA